MLVIGELLLDSSHELIKAEGLSFYFADFKTKNVKLEGF